MGSKRKTQQRRRYQEHETVPLLIGDKIYEIDKNVVVLIQLLNSVPGLQTRFSCEGTRRGEEGYLAEDGYVMLEGPKLPKFASLLSEHLMSIINETEPDSKYDIYHDHFKMEFQRRARFELEGGGNSPCLIIRWNPEQYGNVVMAVADVMPKLVRKRRNGRSVLGGAGNGADERGLPRPA